MRNAVFNVTSEDPIQHNTPEVQNVVLFSVTCLTRSFLCYSADSKPKAKQAVNKRRKCEEDEKKAGVKRLKTDATSDLSESSDSENAHKSAVHFSCSSSSLSSSSSSSSSSSEPNSENELKSRSSDPKLNIVKKEEDEKPLRVLSTNSCDSSSAIDGLSPWVDLQATGENKQAVIQEMDNVITKEEEELVAVTQITQIPRQQIPLICESVEGSVIGKSPPKGTDRLLPAFSSNPSSLS